MKILQSSSAQAAGRGDPLEGPVTEITNEKQVAGDVHLLSEALKSIGEAVTITDLLNRVVFANAGFYAMYGYQAHEIVGMSVDRLRVEDECSQPLEVIARETLRGGWRGDIVNQRKDGSRFPARLSTSVVRGDDGQPVALIGVTKDLTEEKRLQNQLFQAQRLEAVGRLAGGVAHDFNNLLTVINGYAEVLLEAMAESDPSRAPLEQIARSGKRAANLVQQLLAFSRKQVTQPKVLNLNQRIAGNEKMVRRLIGEDVRLTTRLAPDLGSIKADPGQIDQILLNLAVNSRDAMPRGGELTIATANCDSGRSYQSFESADTAGRYVMLTVTDTGHGMDDTTREKVFEPFFTTKEIRRASGLGLSTVYGIVKQNRGFIQVASKKGRGTRFRIYLPRIVDARASGLRAVGAGSVQGGSETILLVEDDGGVCDVTARLLEASGYRVLQAGCASEAMAIAAAHPGEIPLMITDVVLPGMSGNRLAQRLRGLRPELKVLFMSGYADDTITRCGIRPGRESLIQKPYSTTDLLQRIRTALDHGRRTTSTLQKGPREWRPPRRGALLSPSIGEEPRPLVISEP